VSPDPAQWLPALRRGDPAAIGALYDLYAPDLLRLATRLLTTSADAEDVVHDLFVGLPELLSRYEHRDALLAWLRAVTVRMAHMRRRRETRRSGVLTSLFSLDERLPVQPESALDLTDAVAALPDSLRDVFVLKQWEGYTHEEIAQLLDITVSASRVRLTRALKFLRTALER
jgi:RNA polymerase sigma-70 factor, ECF subfamily